MSNDWQNPASQNDQNNPWAAPNEGENQQQSEQSASSQYSASSQPSAEQPWNQQSASSQPSAQGWGEQNQTWGEQNQSWGEQNQQAHSQPSAQNYVYGDQPQQGGYDQSYAQQGGYDQSYAQPAYAPQQGYADPYAQPGAYGQMAPYGVSAEAPYGIEPSTGIPYSDKQKMTAGLLQIFLGSFGVGRFYTGHVGLAIGQIAATWLTFGVGAIWPLVDGIMMLTSRTTDAQGRPLR